MRGNRLWHEDTQLDDDDDDDGGGGGGGGGGEGVSQVKSLVKVLLWVYERGTIFYGRYRYMKGLPFLSQMVFKRVRVWTLGQSLSVYNFVE